MKKTASSKRYPFSMAKHGHDIELYRNKLYLEDKMDRYWEVTALLLRAKDAGDGRLTWLDGQDLQWTKEIVAWAENYRAEQMQRS